jgi:hypothetical protein
MSIGSASGPLGATAQGTLIRARVLGNLDSGAVVLVKGKPVKVPSGTALSEGQEVQGKLVSRQGRLEFQLEKADSQKTQSSALAGRAHLSSFLKSNGIPQTELTLLTGYKAMQLGQPLTPQLFSQILRFSGLLPDVSENSVHALLFLASRGLPIQRRGLGLFKSYLDQRRGLRGLFASGEFKTAWKFFKGLLPELNSEGFSLKSFFLRSGLNLESQLAKGQSILSDWVTLLRGEGHKKLSGKFKDFLGLLKLANTVEPGEQPQVLMVPYTQDDEPHELVLKYWRESSKREKGQSSDHLEIYLEMSQLGSLMLGFSVDHGVLTLGLHTADPTVAEALERASETFESEVMDLGRFTRVEVQVRQSPSEIEVPRLLPLQEREPVKIDMKA